MGHVRTSKSGTRFDTQWKCPVKLESKPTFTQLLQVGTPTVASILGNARYLPVYNDVAGNGANASSTISKFVSVRVMDAKLNGQPKWIVVQPVSKIKGPDKG